LSKRRRHLDNRDLTPPPTPAAQWRATSQPIIVTAGRWSIGIGYRLPATNKLPYSFNV